MSEPLKGDEGFQTYPPHGSNKSVWLSNCLPVSCMCSEYSLSLSFSFHCFVLMKKALTPSLWVSRFFESRVNVVGKGRTSNTPKWAKVGVNLQEAQRCISFVSLYVPPSRLSSAVTFPLVRKCHVNKSFLTWGENQWAPIAPSFKPASWANEWFCFCTRGDCWAETQFSKAYFVLKVKWKPASCLKLLKSCLCWYDLSWTLCTLKCFIVRNSHHQLLLAWKGKNARVQGCNKNAQ